MPPAARLTDLHVCPMTPVVPHVGGPIVGPCAPTVFTGFMPQARITDMAVCAGPLDTIAKGSATVIVSYLPAARFGDLCAHGGTIVTGFPTVMIGDSGNSGAGGAAASAGAFAAPWKQAAAFRDAAAAGTPFCERCNA